MAEENKSLTGSFKAAAETERVLQEVRAYNSKLQKHATSPDATLAGLATLGREITGQCIEIVKNQQRQNARMDELEKRLAQMEGSGIVRLDKPAKKLPEPKT